MLFDSFYRCYYIPIELSSTKLASAVMLLFFSASAYEKQKENVSKIEKVQARPVAFIVAMSFLIRD